MLQSYAKMRPLGQTLSIDLICQVVDNYGDIAVVWRLAQALLEDCPSLGLRIVVDDTTAFHALNPAVDPESRRQELECSGGRVTVLKTPVDDDDPADVVVEAFGAPTPPSWLERFYATPAVALRCRLLIHLEYLTAEAWSERYHLLPSPLGRAGVERVFFVPGFRRHTGGLVFTDCRPQPYLRGPEDWLMTLFSYEHDFTQFWTELADFLEERRQTARVLVFAGRSRAGALASWARVCHRRGAERIVVVDQPLLDQDSYTAVLAAADFNVVRGEESWVQALLAGRPFLWHAYLQDAGHQLVKVEAFLEVAQEWFDRAGATTELRLAVEREFRAFNRRLVNSADTPAGESYRVFWQHRDVLVRIGEAWSAELRKNAKLSRRLLDFLESYRL